MNKIAIKPHKNRGNEIIKIFENRGFRNPSKYDGNYSENITKDYAFIGGCDGAEDCIILTDIAYLENIGYKVCTLEEYEDEMIEGLAIEESQKKMVSLDKVCDLLYAMLCTQDINDYDYVTAPAYDNVEDFVEDFRKTMEKYEKN